MIQISPGSHIAGFRPDRAAVAAARPRAEPLAVTLGIQGVHPTHKRKHPMNCLTHTSVKARATGAMTKRRIVAQDFCCV